MIAAAKRVGAVAAGWLALAAWLGPAADRPQDPKAGEGVAIQSFWDAFQHHQERRSDAIARLSARALAADATAKERLYAGLAHLWALAEGGGDAVQSHAHAVLAEHWLARAEAADPADTRIAGWRQSARWAIADLEHDEAARAAAVARLEALAHAEPCFHSVPLGIVAFDLPRTHEGFTKALAALEAAFACGAERGGQDRPKWPHNVAGYLVALADFRLKAGDLAGAEAALVIAEARESTAHWPHRRLLDERLGALRERAVLYADDDPANDPPFALRSGTVSCSACHAAAVPSGPARR